MAWAFDNSFWRDLPGTYAEQPADQPTAPVLLQFNHDLASRLGLDLAGLDDQDLARLMSGAIIPEGAQPLAQAYAGHQFGNFTPQLGDGRALLLGEIVAPDGPRFDMQLKGSGRTAFSRGGDGKAAIGPVLREYLISESMHALGVPTTRSLAAVATGDPIWRDGELPGAVLCRIAASHIRIGTFQYFAARQDQQRLTSLTRYALDRHFPEQAENANSGLALLRAVCGVQAELVAHWMSIGFVHGVMNTDNVTISGETIDYGPCAFMDLYASDAVFSSIDRAGRYAYGNQPHIALWNLTRLAESLLTTIADDGDCAVELATGVLNEFTDLYQQAFLSRMRAKLGMTREKAGDFALVNGLFAAMEAQQVDFTGLFRSLSSEARGEEGAARGHFLNPGVIDGWLAEWRARLSDDHADLAHAANAMDQVNPLYIPRNHKVEDALSAATQGDLAPFEALLARVRSPFDWQAGHGAFAQPAPAGAARYVTFCGT